MRCLIPGFCAVVLAACTTSTVAPIAPPAPPTVAAPVTAATSTPRGPNAAAPATLASAVAADPAAAAPVKAREPRYQQLGPPATPRSAQDLRLQLAQRLVAAHPDTSYTSPAPDRLWAIPVLEIELNADGSVRKIAVLRKPTTGDEATVLAMAAVRRAAPYGDVSRLRKPWKVVETFLFDDELRFKPRTLDLN